MDALDKGMITRHTTPNPHLPKMDVFPKYFLKIILATLAGSVYLEETVEFSWSIWKKRMNSTVSFKTT